MHSDDIFNDWDMIHSYSRRQAIEDGVLVDVTESAEARELRFRFPVALTRAVWEQCVEVPAGVELQDKHGRLWDLLFMLALKIRVAAPGQSTIDFKVHVRNDNRAGFPPAVELVAVCGPGDDGKPVITVMFPGED